MFFGSVVALLVWISLDIAIRSGFTRFRAHISNIPSGKLWFLERVSRISLLVVVLLTYSEIFGIAPQELWTTFLTVIGLVSVALVAFWSSLSSFVCGLILLVSRPFTIGDTVEVFDPSATDKPGTRGTVVDITGLYLVLEEAVGEKYRIYIPHNQVLQRGIRVLSN